MNEHDNLPERHHEDRPHNKDGHEVGYGKPPVHSRFKPGNRGRPKGSKKRSFSLSEIITEAMTRRRKVRRGERVVSMQVAEIFVERLIAMATSGSPSEMTKVLTMIARHAPHLLSAPELEARITYHRAPGSEVELPPAHLWTAPKELKK